MVSLLLAITQRKTASSFILTSGSLFSAVQDPGELEGQL